MKTGVAPLSRSHRSALASRETDRHAPVTSLDAAGRASVAQVYHPPDEIELACPACTLELGEGGRWQHERSCPARARR